MKTMKSTDVVAKEASSLDQADVPLDFLTVKTAVKAHFRKVWRSEVAATKGIYAQAGTLKPPVFPSKITRKEETTIRQLRTGTSPLVRGNWARYAGKTDEERLCPHGCNTVETVEHLFWNCPLYTAQRLKIFGTTDPPRDVLFHKDYLKILKFLADTGHLAAPTAEHS